MGRSIGLDVHRDFCEVAIADGGRARSAGRVATTPERLRVLAMSLRPDDRVVLEATGNALAIARILAPHCAEVVMAHARDVRAISHARVKTDKLACACGPPGSNEMLAVVRRARSPCR
jgi:transposase